MKKLMLYFPLILTTTIWGSNYVFSQRPLQVYSAGVLLLFRTLISLAVLLPVLFLQARKMGGLPKFRKGDMKYFIFVGVVGYGIGVGSQFFAMSRIDPSLASLINAANPVAILIAAYFILGEAFTRKKQISLVLVMIGACIVIGFGKGEPIGIAASILSLITWASAVAMMRKLGQYYPPLMNLCMGLALSLLFIVPLTIGELAVNGPLAPLPDVETLLCILYLGAVGLGVAQLSWNFALTKLEAGLCGLFYPLQPISTMILSALILHQPITASLVVGAVFIIAGVLISTRPEKGKESV